MYRFRTVAKGVMMTAAGSGTTITHPREFAVLMLLCVQNTQRPPLPARVISPPAAHRHRASDFRRIWQLSACATHCLCPACEERTSCRVHRRVFPTHWLRRGRCSPPRGRDHRLQPPFGVVIRCDTTCTATGTRQACRLQAEARRKFAVRQQRARHRRCRRPADIQQQHRRGDNTKCRAARS